MKVELLIRTFEENIQVVQGLIEQLKKEKGYEVELELREFDKSKYEETIRKQDESARRAIEGKAEAPRKPGMGTSW